TIWAAIRDGSKLTLLVPSKNAPKPYAPTNVNNAEPTATSMWVRSPAAFSSSSRSRPTAPPSAAATTTRRRVPSQPREGRSATRRIDCLLLRGRDQFDSLRRQLEQLVELLAAEGGPFRGRLHLDQPAVAGHHHVQV